MPKQSGKATNVTTSDAGKSLPIDLKIAVMKSEIS
jgi:hypothetical protein